MASWAMVVLSLRNLRHAAIGDSATVSTDSKRILEDLRTAGVADDDLVTVIDELKGLRDQVAHGFHRPTSGETLTYASSATLLRQSLDFLANSLRSPSSLWNPSSWWDYSSLPTPSETDPKATDD